ncbi:MAG TPA: tRNA (adenosine(37)-N6)-threonylcarbamoyltransferase complex ATPase subunit type 1 TsaE, partial [Cyclobacteriaceae bacterium]|nr:tRNA (adenosine(37)-N6)-threonylcarbamoyltransferase complex ATPase subunit type 1 TsaE [Cyclobacteriaceae bacterium]
MPEAWQTANDGEDVELNKLDAVVEELLQAAEGVQVWLIDGEMGSGKTTLIKAVGKALGVAEAMSSPTFSIVNEYKGKADKKICHFDLYRLNNEKDVFDIGVEEYFDSNQLCLVEWPERLGSLKPAK